MQRSATATRATGSFALSKAPAQAAGQAPRQSLFRGAITIGAPGGSVLAPSGTSPRTSNLGIDVMYARLLSASMPGDVVPTNPAIGGATHVSDADNWQFRFRVHRDFYP